MDLVVPGTHVVTGTLSVIWESASATSCIMSRTESVVSLWDKLRKSRAPTTVLFIWYFLNKHRRTIKKWIYILYATTTCILSKYLFIYLFIVSKVPLLQSCGKDEECADHNAICTRGTCQCRNTHYHEQNNTCCKYSQYKCIFEIKIQQFM